MTFIAPKMYKGEYSKIACKHCQQVLEAGPRLLAKWVFCGWCYGPVHNKYPCNSHCDRAPQTNPWDASRYRDKVAEYIQADPDGAGTGWHS